jgi:hypothetical protein
LNGPNQRHSNFSSAEEGVLHARKSKAPQAGSKEFQGVSSLDQKHPCRVENRKEFASFGSLD